MLRKLRRQFILSNMLLSGIVIFSVFFALIAISYHYEEDKSIDALSSALNGNASVTIFENGSPFVVSQRQITNGETVNEKEKNIFFMALTDKNKNIIVSETALGVSLDDATIRKIVKIAANSKDDVGVIPSYTIRYMRVATDDGGYKIAFADRSDEVASLTFMVRLYLFTALFAMSIMFLISDYMAHKSISPVEKSWNNQRRFVADASHELKTPLTVILANMDIMSSNPESTIEDQAKWIDNTRSEASRMTQLVNDMLFLAKSDAAAPQVTNFMMASFSNLVEDCVLTFESVAFEKGIKLSYNIQENIIINIDEAKMKQVIMILLDNAIKYVNEKGEINVDVAAFSKSVKLSVSNTGVPIPKSKQKHVFERFFRAEDSRVRTEGGSGLGLSIADNIVAAHKGRIALDYSNDKGTCFSVTLPLKGPSSRKGKKG